MTTAPEPAITVIVPGFEVAAFAQEALDSLVTQTRADWTAARGGKRAWRQFHDRFLSYGGPPLPLVRQQMLGGAAKAVF